LTLEGLTIELWMVEAISVFGVRAFNLLRSCALPVDILLRVVFEGSFLEFDWLLSLPFDGFNGN